ncbi:MAG: hypothetical protein RLZZ40_850, partial [Actinomycetota bacterium]
RLPDRLTAPAYPAALAMVASEFPAHLELALQTSAIAIAIGVLLHLTTGLGFGDVKLLGVLGLAIGGAGTVFNSTVVVMCAGGLHALAHIVNGGGRREHIPFGPALLTGLVPVAAVLT